MKSLRESSNINSFSRRSFLKGLAVPSTAIIGGLLPSACKMDVATDSKTKLTVLHTNDTHSRIDPMPKSKGTLSGKAGVSRRATLIRKIRNENPNVLLLDAGDTCQGTPYFNLFKGQLEYRMMSLIGYDIGNLGNHEFDNGIESLLLALNYTNFPIVNSNYLISHPELKMKIPRYIIKKYNDIKVGIFGLCIDLKHYVISKNYKGIKFMDPIKVAREMVITLREKQKCDLVICISHLGIKEEEGIPGDREIANAIKGIDLIVGGHSHTFMEQPEVVRLPSGWETHIFQMGVWGAYLGRLDFNFSKKHLSSIKAHRIIV